MSSPIVPQLHEALSYHLSRHNLLTANLAHVDTPGFKPKDLHRVQRFAEVLDVTMRAEHPDHFGTRGVQPRPWEVRDDPNARAGADGNAVNLDREAVKIASNTLRYDAIATLIQGHLTVADWAARDGRGG